MQAECYLAAMRTDTRVEDGEIVYGEPVAAERIKAAHMNHEAL
jgi:hypothetical protein